MLKQYKIALLIIGILLFTVSIMGLGYLNYEAPVSDLDHAMVYVDGNLSFNFIEGNVIKTSESEMEYHFSVTNTSSDAYYYNLSLEDVFGGEHVDFEVKSNREGFQTISKKYPETDVKFASTIKIGGSETHSYTFVLHNPEQEMVDGKIVIDLEKEMSAFANVILKNNVLNSATKTDIASAATEDEGLLESTDEAGISYYFRGDVGNNYVSFAGFTWRIVKINGDGTVKLVLNELASNNIQFYDKNEYYDLSFDSSKIYNALDTWYQNNLSHYDSIIANSKYCTDSTYDDYGFSSLTRIYTNHAPLYQCLGTTNTLKIGLLTADEVSFAGGAKGTQNTGFYLYNSNIKSGWWTMSPAKNQNDVYSFIEVGANGQLNEGTTGTLFRGMRPVINLIKKTTVTGSGTEEEPYLVNLA